MRPVPGWAPGLKFSVEGYGAGIYGEGAYGVDQVDIPPIPRGAVSWRALNGNRYMAFGSFNRLFAAFPDTDSIFDIAPSDLMPGYNDATLNNGYGSGAYGQGPYGIERSDVTEFLPATVWSLDTWGEYLVACSPDDGRLLEWQLDTTTAAAVIANAPTDCVGLLVTDERFLFALGAGGNFRKVQWSDRENNTLWTPAATNEAGDIELQTVGQIMLGIRAKGQALILTDVDAHTATYQGPPFVYGFQRVGDGCGAISRACAAATDAGVFWMTDDGFRVFDGTTVRDVQCEVADYVFRDMNRTQRSKIWAVPNVRNGEVWWFYPSAEATEISRYVSYNWAENHWSIGQLTRVAGVDSGVLERPFWFDATGNGFQHEIGFDRDGIVPFAETGPFELGNGDQIMNVLRLIPDEQTQGDVTMSFKTRYYPQGPETTHGPYTMSAPTSVRFQGRQTALRVEEARPADWRVGSARLEVKPGSRR